MSEAPEATQHLEYYIFENVRAIHIHMQSAGLHRASNTPQKICSPCHSQWNIITLHQLQTEGPQKTQSILTDLFFGYRHP